MFTKKVMVLFSVLLFSFGSVVIAKKSDDFFQEDYDRLLRGEKNMTGAQLQGADLSGKNLSGVDFKGAELEEVNFQKADLSNASFRNADLEEANLKGANIKGAVFSGAELEFATWVDGRVCAEDSVGGCW